MTPGKRIRLVGGPKLDRIIEKLRSEGNGNRAASLNRLAFRKSVGRVLAGDRWLSIVFNGSRHSWTLPREVVKTARTATQRRVV